MKKIQSSELIQQAYPRLLTTTVTGLTVLNWSLSTIRSSLAKKLEDFRRNLPNSENQQLLNQPKVLIRELPASIGPKVHTNQLDRLRAQKVLRVAIRHNKAYWVFNNTFFVADIENHRIMQDTARPLDASELSDSEIESLFKTLDEIIR